MAIQPKLRYSESIVGLIGQRRSVRTYSARALPADVQDGIAEYLSPSGPFGARTRFVFLDRQLVADQKKIRLGTYGWIQGASSFIAAASDKSGRSLLQLGFQLEDAILYLTSRGLGTCWLAATFNKSVFSKAAAIRDDEILPVITPVGYPRRIRSPIDFAIKPVPGMKPRMGWKSLFFDGSFERSLTPEAAGGFRVPLEMVRLAPSASNRQPWRVLRRGDRFHFFLDHDPAYAHRHPYDVQMIDLGIAMCHFQRTAEELAMGGRWIFENPGIGDGPEHIEHIAAWDSR